jgi:hypothetical protein
MGIAPVTGAAGKQRVRTASGGGRGLADGEVDAGRFTDADEGEGLVRALVAGDDAGGDGRSEEGSGVELVGE